MLYRWQKQVCAFVCSVLVHSREENTLTEWFDRKLGSNFENDLLFYFSEHTRHKGKYYKQQINHLEKNVSHEL